ncbi:MAG TPA: hypothetical protein VIX20_10765, partial [Ktedonobacteraceae bacterium]
AVAISVAPVASPVAKAVTPITRQLTPDKVSTSNSDPQTPVPAYMAQSSSMSRIPPAFPVGQTNPPPLIFEPSINQTSTVGNFPEDRDDSDITLARKTYSLQDNEGIGSHIYWSIEPVEWSPIGEETGNSMPATASEYLSNKPTPPEIVTNMSSSPLKPILDEETRSAEKYPDSRLKKLLPILVVILLLIGLIAALLSSFFLPAPPSSGNTGKEQLVVEVRSMPANANRQVTDLSITI